MNLGGNIKLLVSDTASKSTNSNDNKIDKIDSSIDHEVKQPSEEDNKRPQEPSKKGRCAMCNKKLKLTAIQCKCNNYYCDMHRYSDCHDCKFDYKNNARNALEKNNPVVISKKLDNVL